MIKNFAPFRSAALVTILTTGFCLGQETKENSADDLKAETHQSWFQKELVNPATPDFKSSQVLTKEEVAGMRQKVYKSYKYAARQAGWNKHILPNQKLVKGAKPKIEAAIFEQDGKKMPYTVIVHGQRPKGGYPLFFSMHGGGMYSGKEELKSPHGWGVNTNEWQTQMKFAVGGVYQPAGVYFIPRMADDNLGRWWHPFNIKIFKRAIRLTSLFNDVNPNKVYMMGISQGGYGTCHIAPFMADHLAAAGAMAGGMMTQTENLRNLPFRSDIGEGDTAYNRIKLAKALHAKLDENKAKDPKGFINKLNIQAGKGHGIDYRMTPVWLAKFTRNPYPNKIVWRCFSKKNYYAKNFYWLSLSDTPKSGEFKVTAVVNKKTNTINVSAEEVIPAKEKGGKASEKALQSSDLIVHLNDRIINLDKAVTINVNGKQLFKGIVERKLANIVNNLSDRGDINYAFPAQVTIKLKK